MPGPKPIGPRDAGDRAAEDGRHRSGGLSDRDCYLLLSRGGLGGWSGLTLADYAALSDRQILALLTVDWNEDGSFVREQASTEAPAGSIAAAGRELPAPECLDLSEEDLQRALALRVGPDVRYLTMFLSVWKGRGKSTQEALGLWREHLATSN